MLPHNLLKDPRRAGSSKHQASLGRKLEFAAPSIGAGHAISMICRLISRDMGSRNSSYAESPRRNPDEIPKSVQAVYPRSYKVGKRWSGIYKSSFAIFAALLTLLQIISPSKGEVAFADTCACPDSSPCPSFCLECDSYDSECTSGKTNARCNGEDNQNCPDGYDKRAQTGTIWRCSYGGTYYTMYHCHRYCLGILTGKCNLCQDGYYAYNENQTCALCDAGHYCHSGQDQGPCDKGYFCEAGSTSATEAPCPAGTYGSTTGLEDSSCSGPCQAGYYCPEGSTNATVKPCFAGQWGGSGQTNGYCSGSCSAGYYCPQGSASSKAHACGDASKYCPEGSSTPTAVSDGFYSTPVSLPENVRTTETVCPKGSYCSGGQKTTCPAGNYAPSIGLSSCLEYVCTAGYYCPEGSTSSTAGPCYTGDTQPTYPAMYYCPAGATAPAQVLDGYFTTPESALAYHRTGMELADSTLYVTRYGTRYRKVQWQGDCTGDSGTLQILELTNDGRGDASEGALLTTFQVYDNINQIQLESGALTFVDAAGDSTILSSSLNAADCISYVQEYGFPFEITESSDLEIRTNFSLDYEVCPKFVFDVLATSANGEATSTCRLTVNVENENDKPYFEYTTTAGYPYAQPATKDFYVEERSDVNTGVGSPIHANDEDVGQEISFEIVSGEGDEAENMFYIGSCSGQLYVLDSNLDYITKDTYNLVIRVCDDGNFFGSSGVTQCSVDANITIHVQDVNDSPFWSTSPYEITSFYVPENSPENTLLTPYCQNGTDEVPCSELDSSIGGLLVDDLDLASDGSSTSDIMIYTITRNVNDYFAAVSCDRENNIDECTLSNGVNAPAGALRVTQVADLNYEEQTTYTIAVRVNDGRGGVNSTEVTIKITDANDPPTWPTNKELGALQIAENNANGYVSIFANDEDAGDILTYEVVQVADKDENLYTNLFVIDPDSPSAAEGETVKLELGTNGPLDFESVQFYYVTVNATDSGGLSTGRVLNITVQDVNESPTITTTDLYVAENVAYGTQINGAVQFTDPDEGQIGFFSIESGSDSSYFAIGTTSGIISVRGDLNYEQKNVYTVQVSVTDNGVPSKKTTSAITIHVTDEPEPPTFESGQTFTVTETPEIDTDWAVLINVTDEDAGDSATLYIDSQYIASNGKPVEYFAVSNLSLIENINSDPPNYESALFTTYNDKRIIVSLYALDTTGLNSSSTVTITVVDANDRPVLENATVGVPAHISECDKSAPCSPGYEVLNIYELCTDEDLDSDELITEMTYTILSGNEDETFGIEDGVLTVINVTENIRQENFIYNLTIEATDHATTPLTSSAAYIQVKVTGENYPPTLNSFTLTLAENTEANGQVLINDFNASDPNNDANTPMQGLVFDISKVSPTSAADVFDLDSSNGTLYLMETIDYETMTDSSGKITVYVRVRDNFGDSSSLSTIGTVTITVTDVNEPPSFSASTYSVSVTEGTSVGVITTIEASDPDEADDGQLVYSLPNITTGLFVVNSATGAISTTSVLDFESPQSPCKLSSGALHQCSIDLMVTDTAGHSALTVVKVSVINVNEKPNYIGTGCETGFTCTSSILTKETSVTIPESSYISSALKVATFKASDPDYISGYKLAFATLSFSFPDGEELDSGASRVDELFRLDSSGGLYLVGHLDFENRSSYTYDIVVSDESNGVYAALQDTFTLTIHVADVNDISTVNATTVDTPWPTGGGTSVNITGDNFGPREYKIDTENATMPDVRVYLVQKSTLRTFEASGCYVASATSVLCSSSPSGVGEELYWMLSYPGLGYNSSIDFDDESLANRFQDPVITSVSGATAFPTAGGATFSVYGTDLGAADLEFTPTVEVRYRSATARSTVFTATNCGIVSSEQVTCTSSPSSGPKLEFMVVIQGQEALEWYGNGSVYSHAIPVITSLAFEDSSTTQMNPSGGSSSNGIVLTGTNFGPLGTSIVVTYGPSTQLTKFTASSCSVKVAHKSVRCVYVAGTGSDLKFTIAVNSVISSASTQGLSYTGPIIDSISGAGAENARTSGGETVYIKGSGFGPVTTSSNSTLVVQYGGENADKYTAVDCAVTKHDTTITCQTTSGTGPTLYWKVTVSGQSSAISTVSTSYSAPTINYFEGQSTDAITEGGDEIVLVGVDFGDDSDLINVTFGPTGQEYIARNCIIDPDNLHTKIICELPPGIGDELKWTVVVDTQASKVPTSSYRAPTITSLVGDPIDNGAKTSGGETFKIYGTDFGPRSVQQREQQYEFTYGVTAGSNYQAINCVILPSEPSYLTIYTASSQNATIDSGYFVLEVNSVETQALQYDASAEDLAAALFEVTEGVVFNVTRASNCLVLSPTSNSQWNGGCRWTITTPSLPRETISVSTNALTADGAAAYASVSQPDLGASSAQCTTVPGVGADLDFVATIGGQESNVSTVFLSYIAPSITSYVPALGVSAEDFVLTVNGNNFGIEDITVMFAGTLMQDASQTHTKVEFSIPEVLQRNQNNVVQIEVGGQTVTSSYSFQAPRIQYVTAVSPPEVLEGPPQEIVIRGTGFGYYQPELNDAVTVDGQECIISQWTHEAILCNLTKLDGTMRITVGELYGELPNFSYSGLLTQPVIHNVSRCDDASESIGCISACVNEDDAYCTTQGDYKVVIFGQNLGSGINGVVYINGEECEVEDALLDYTDNKTICSVPEGEGSGPVIVQHAFKRSNESVIFYYDRPHLNSASPDRGSTPGNTELHLVGQNFGVSGPLVDLLAEWDPTYSDTCEVVRFNHTYIKCILPPGQGKMRIRVTAGEQESDGNSTFTYDPPSLSYISPVHGSTEGGYNMTLVGSNFGIQGNVFVGGSICDFLSYSHEEIICAVPPGAGSQVEVLVESGGASSNALNFSYDPPYVSSLDPGYGPTSGGSEITVHGENFHNADLYVQFGEFNCTEPNATSSTLIVCTSPEGIGTNLSVIVSVKGQATESDKPLFSFSAPIVTRVSPDPVDAYGGDELVITGSNFGKDEFDADPDNASVEVFVSDVECETPHRYNHTRITCDVRNVSVGDHPITLYVAEQSVTTSNKDGLFAACTSGYYGQPSEYCRVCPDNAECLGYVNGWHYDPASLAGYGSLNRNTFQACNPSYACLGNDTCAVGYEHQSTSMHLCGLCADNYYRLDGDCVECPKMAWLILIGCFFVAGFLCSVAYFLTKYGVQLAAVSICIDFCQVVSLFSSYDFAWPRVVSSAYSVLSAFNLNLELASPECSVGWDYETKWYIMYFMPVVFGFMFTGSFLIAFVKHMFRKVQKEVKVKTGISVVPFTGETNEKNAQKTKQVTEREVSPDEKVLLVDDEDMESYDASFNKFIDAEFGAFLLMCYYLYMSVMKKCFEVYRCQGSPVPVLIAEPSEPCDDSGSFYPRIHALAGFGIFVYGVGIPGVILFLLLKHRDFIKHDQQRREQALKLSENEAAKRLQSAFRGYYVRRVVDPRSILRQHKKLSNIGRTRAKFGKLYEDFTSECYYWRLVLMMRKLLLSMISLFLDDKFKQSTLAFGILFSSYAMQVKLRPYLSRFPDDLAKRRQAKAYTEWKRRAELRSEVNRTKGRVRALQLAVSAKMKRLGIKTARDDRLLRENMDFKQLEVNKDIAKWVHTSREAHRQNAIDNGSLDPDQARKETDVQRRWGLLQHFVTEADNKDKFELNDDASKYLKSDALRWIFDYNTLETLSLATLMYILLFGLLFDTYEASSDDIRINVLASITIALFVMVILLFMSSVVIDVKRKFWPAVRDHLLKHGVRGLAPRKLMQRLRGVGKDGPARAKVRAGATVTPARDSAKAVLNGGRGQWVSPVNPFATLEKQNADLVRAEEARLQAIMASKMRHQEELREREVKRQQEQARLDEEYRLKMESVEAELRELEEQEAAMLDSFEGDHFGESDGDEAMAAFAEQELAAAVAEADNVATVAPLQRDEDADSDIEEADAAFHEAKDMEAREMEAREMEEEGFEAEQEVLMAQLEAEKQEKLVELKARQNDDINAAIAELQRQAEEVCAGHRKQQDEIKARLQERTLRRGRSVRRRKRNDGGANDDGTSQDGKEVNEDENDEEESLLTEEQEIAVRELEEKIMELQAKQEAEIMQFEEEIESTKQDKLQKLRQEVHHRVERELQEDVEFDRMMAEELSKFQEETKALVAEIEIPSMAGPSGGEEGDTNEIDEDEAKRLREQYEASMARLQEKRNAEMAALREKLDRKRKERIQKSHDEEKEREEKRLKQLEEAEKNKLKAQEKELQLAEQRKAEANLPEDFEDAEAEDHRAAVQKLRENFEQATSELARKQKEQRDHRREALERKLEARRKATEERNQKKLEAAAKKEDKVFVQALKVPEPVEEDSEKVAARLEQLKKDALANKAVLDQKNQDDKKRLRERLLKKRQQAEEKKKKMLEQKAKEETLMHQKLKEEEAALRERQAIELQEIEEANVEAFLDETQAESLAAGVLAWRKRREDQEKQQAVKGPTRSEILAADFAAKAQRIEELSVTSSKTDSDSGGADAGEKAKKEAERLLKDLETLFVSLVEETDAEINKMTNEAAVQKARKKRQLRNLRRQLMPEASEGMSPLSPEEANSPLSGGGKEDSNREAMPVNVNLDNINFLDL